MKRRLWSCMRIQTALILTSWLIGENVTAIRLQSSAAILSPESCKTHSLIVNTSKILGSSHLSDYPEHKCCEFYDFCVQHASDGRPLGCQKVTGVECCGEQYAKCLNSLNAVWLKARRGVASFLERANAHRSNVLITSGHNAAAVNSNRPLHLPAPNDRLSNADVDGLERFGRSTELNALREEDETIEGTSLHDEDLYNPSTTNEPPTESSSSEEWISYKHSTMPSSTDVSLSDGGNDSSSSSTDEHHPNPEAQLFQNWFLTAMKSPLEESDTQNMSLESHGTRPVEHTNISSLGLSPDITAPSAVSEALHAENTFINKPHSMGQTGSKLFARGPNPGFANKFTAERRQNMRFSPLKDILVRTPGIETERMPKETLDESASTHPPPTTTIVQTARHELPKQTGNLNPDSIWLIDGYFTGNWNAHAAQMARLQERDKGPDLDVIKRIGVRYLTNAQRKSLPPRELFNSIGSFLRDDISTVEKAKREMNKMVRKNRVHGRRKLVRGRTDMKLVLRPRMLLKPFKTRVTSEQDGDFRVR